MKLSLELCAKLENVSELKAGEDFYYYLKIRCSNCNHETGKWHGVSLSQEFPSRNSGKSTNHFVMTCHECKRESTLTILENSMKSYLYDSNHEETFQSVVTFESRGLEPIEFEARDGWTVKGPSTSFTNVSFDNGDWSDYDDRANEAVSILSLRHRFVRA